MSAQGRRKSQRESTGRQIPDHMKELLEQDKKKAGKKGNGNGGGNGHDKPHGRRGGHRHSQTG